MGSDVPSSTKRLVIVESPAKAKKISGFLGPDYVVEASFGHVRDLPRNAADVPAKYKGEAWARLGVDVDNGFSALYVVSSDRKAQITKLIKLAKEVDEVLLATDEDREGEAIAWHLLETIKPKVPVKRMVFHEITKPAIQAAVANPRDIDRALVDAQEARRILDRLYGYEVSPVLWKKVMPKSVGGPGPVGGDPDRGPARAPADGVPIRRATGTSAPPWPPSKASRTARVRSRRPWWRSTATGLRQVVTSTRRQVVPTAPSYTWMRPVHGGSPSAWTGGLSR